MQIIDLPQNTPEWLDYRLGKISGTILGDVYSKRGGRKIGFYQLIADKLGLPPDEENRMDRGLRLEEEAAGLYAGISGKELTQVGICVSSFSPEVINSPDRLIMNRDTGFYDEAVEIKCLSPARHLQAVIEDKIPGEFESQVMQYFIVNDELKVLHVVFYDPRVIAKSLHVVDVFRSSVEDKIGFFKKWQLDTLAEIDKIVEELAF